MGAQPDPMRISTAPQPDPPVTQVTASGATHPSTKGAIRGGTKAVTPDVTRLQHQAMHLERALEHARDIGIAMGIVMATNKVTRRDAFELLRAASQNQNRRLFLVAAEVAETGTVPATALAPPSG